MTTGRINQVHASPQVATHSQHFRVGKCVRNLVALHQKLNPNFRSATLCATLLTIKTYTMTPELKTPRHSKNVMGSPSRLGCCMLRMLSFVIHTPTLSAHRFTSLITSEVTTSNTCCSPTTDLSHISWWSRVGLQRYRRYAHVGNHNQPKGHVMLTGRRQQSQPAQGTCHAHRQTRLSHTPSLLGSSQDRLHGPRR